MTGNRRKSIAYSVAIIFMVVAAVLLLTHRRSGSRDQTGESIDHGLPGGIREPESPRSSDNSARRGPANLPESRKHTLTSPDDPEIHSITDQLNELELRRTSSYREVVKEDRVIYEFIIQYPSGSEANEINRLITNAKGITEDENGRITSWKDFLLRQYLWPKEFSQCIVAIEYEKKTGRGLYSVIGVREGNLHMRNGNAPIPVDGRINMLFSRVSFNYDSNWRFSRLFHSMDESSQSE